MLLGTLGLRTTTLLMIDVNDVDIRCGLLWVREKGRRQRNMILAQPLCKGVKGSGPLLALCD